MSLRLEVAPTTWLMVSNLTLLKVPGVYTLDKVMLVTSWSTLSLVSVE